MFIVINLLKYTQNRVTFLPRHHLLIADQLNNIRHNLVKRYVTTAILFLPSPQGNCLNKNAPYSIYRFTKAMDMP